MKAFEFPVASSQTVAQANTQASLREKYDRWASRIGRNL